MAHTLPRFIILKTDMGKKYLRRIYNSEETCELLEFSGEEAVSPYSKFEVEQAEGEENEGLVHIKSCYNKKYWVCHENQYWVVPDANKKEEDHSKWSCTLFKPIFYDNNIFSLYHVFHGSNAGWWESSDANGAVPKYCLYVGSNLSNDYISYIDWESLSILPERIAFKGSNGYYLSAWETAGRMYLEFRCSRIDDVTVGNQVFTYDDGIRIKSNVTGKFWRLSPCWIWPDSDDTTDDNIDTRFWVNMINSNTISLFNFGNRKYCKGLTTEGKSNCLNACDNTSGSDTHMQIEEFVSKREIYNVTYHLLDIRYYDDNDITMVSQSTTNDSTVSQNQTLELTYKKEQTENWNSSVSVKLGVETKITAGVPSVAEAGVTVSAEVESKIEWGGTTTTSQEVKATYSTVVPSKTTVTVSVTARKVSYNIPFSYSQRDTLFNGEKVDYEMDDGLYSGSNGYKFDCGITESVGL